MSQEQHPSSAHKRPLSSASSASPATMQTPAPASSLDGLFEPGPWHDSLLSSGTRVVEGVAQPLTFTYTNIVCRSEHRHLSPEVRFHSRLTYLQASSEYSLSMCALMSNYRRCAGVITLTRGVRLSLHLAHRLQEARFRSPRSPCTRGPPRVTRTLVVLIRAPLFPQRLM
jgi:hypothetical protein